MESLLKSVRKITISYNDPDATDSDSDVPCRPKRKEIVVLRDKLAPKHIQRCGNEYKTTKKKNPKPQRECLPGVRKGAAAELQKNKLQQGTSSKFPGVRKREWGKFAAEIRNPLDKKRMWLGTFDSEEEAAKAYQSKKAEFEMIIAKMNKISDANNVNCSQHSPSSVLDVATSDHKATAPTKSKKNVVKMADVKPLPRISEIEGEGEFDLKKFQDLMYSWYVEKGSEVATPSNIIKPVAEDLGAWQPSKKAKLGNDEYVPSSPPLSPILNFEQNMWIGNDLKELGFGENIAPNCSIEDEFSDLFELMSFPRFFPGEESDEQDWKQLSEDLLINDCQFSD